jgi:cobalt-zinc-cadmium efflux system membrane fusion protein
LEVKSSDAMVLPDDAIVRFENKEYVFIVKDKNTFEMREVKIGDSENGFTAVSNLTNLSEQSFVTKGAYTLLMKIKNKEE